MEPIVSRFSNSKSRFSNNLTDLGLYTRVYIDGQFLRAKCLKAGSSWEYLGPYNSIRSVLPLEFQELQLVDPDLEDAPAASGAGTIELKGYRCRVLGRTTMPRPLSMHEGLHGGRVSELSKKVGWHHIALLLIGPSSTGNEIPTRRRRKTKRLNLDYLDTEKDPPYVSIKISYRPRELLRAQGIIPGNGESRQGSPIDNKKRVREDGPGSPGPSGSRQKIKSEELSGDARERRIRALQAELYALKAPEQSGTSSVKRERRSPIVVRHAEEVIDLTLEA
ncbi:hypothetical protein EDB92DRAFT_1942367 [Lactarius akahatsu]|uniref:Uncharacterized protein n=1 Tax=Lactarius akahatsu TaxID=416441 RepID=A0AAD4LLJ0_9AGAM|nr:hypothetical protein EDB92DRAFT_1942367 [Lactarius akahatsu]